MRTILQQAQIKELPPASVAVFVGTELDVVAGRGGDDGTPHRRTPWGDIAYQLGGKAAFAHVAEHDRQGQAPGGDVIGKMLPDGSCLILVDELMNYVSRARKSGLTEQLYYFLNNLGEAARGRAGAVLAVSIPASELEMSAEDHSDYQRFKKILDRVGKAVIISADQETSEIIRRRLFEWGGLPPEAHQTVNEYAGWAVEHRQQLPGEFPAGHARDQFAATYPFHPAVLSVFERKWQTLPRFQRTRGILRLLALWVSRAYADGYKGAHRDAIIGLGTAPLEEPFFRAAIMEQLGAEDAIEGVITTDICGKADSHSTRLDAEAVEAIKKARLHRKAAAAIFFESNGGQGSGDSRAAATLPEVRLAVAEPDLDIGNVETVLDALSSSCYYLAIEQNKYRFGLAPNLNKLLADRRASIKDEEIADRVRDEVRQLFKGGPALEKVFFPAKSSDISDRPVLAFVILPPERNMSDRKGVLAWVDAATKENGALARTYKSGLVWCVPGSAAELQEECRKLLAWEAIADEVKSGNLHIEERQKTQLQQNLMFADRDLREAAWRAYRHVLLLGKDNAMRTIDLGLVHSSAAPSIVEFILNHLRQDEEVLMKAPSSSFLVRNWPPAFVEWSTRAVRDAFYASPVFPRLQHADLLKTTIADGVSGGVLAYVGKTTDGRYEPFEFGSGLTPGNIEISDDVFIITKATAEAYKSKLVGSIPPEPPKEPDVSTKDTGNGGDAGTGGKTPPVVQVERAKRIAWSGSIPPQKWTSFYTRVMTRFANKGGVSISVSFNVAPDGGLSSQEIEETRAALRDLGLEDDVKES